MKLHPDKGLTLDFQPLYLPTMDKSIYLINSVDITKSHTPRDALKTNPLIQNWKKIGHRKLKDNKPWNQGLCEKMIIK